MAHFELQPGQTSKAVAHRTVEEIWFFLAGRGQMWRRQNDREEIVAVEPGVCLTIPLGTHFQFRALGARAARCDCRYHAPVARRGRSLFGRRCVAADRVSLGGGILTPLNIALYINGNRTNC